MTQPAPPVSVNYIATLRNAREVALFGHADLAVWRERLRDEDLVPFAVNDRAEMLISSVAARYLGKRFSELSVSLAVAYPRDPATRAGFYLVAAYNSSRMLAFMERTFFQTPYVFGRVTVLERGVRLIDAGATILHVEHFAPSAAPPARKEVWEGSIFLPRKAERTTAPGTVFFARLSGDTEISPFVSGTDVFELRPAPRHPVWQWLLDSRFTATEWHLRPHATHARSKTFMRQY